MFFRSSIYIHMHSRKKKGKEDELGKRRNAVTRTSIIWYARGYGSTCKRSLLRRAPNKIKCIWKIRKIVCAGKLDLDRWLYRYIRKPLYKSPYTPRNSSLLGKKNNAVWTVRGEVEWRNTTRDGLSKKNRPRYSIKLPSFNYDYSSKFKNHVVSE